MPEKLVLKLFVTGRSPRSETAIHNLERLRSRFPDLRMELRIVDVLEEPEAAEAELVAVTPLLVKESPPPVRRVIGDLSNVEKVIFGLGLHPGSP